MGISPGPGVMSIVGYALGSGRRTALASVAGMAIGNLVAMTLSVAGAGAILAESDFWFAILKGVGAAYLITLGILTIRRAGRDAGSSMAMRPITPLAALRANIAIGTFHPKTIVFFVAFVPQFINPHAAYAPQAALLIATFSFVVGLTDSLYALAAAQAARWLRHPAALRWTHRAGGGALVAAGLATAVAKRG